LHNQFLALESLFASTCAGSLEDVLQMRPANMAWQVLRGVLAAGVNNCATPPKLQTAKPVDCEALKYMSMA